MFSLSPILLATLSTLTLTHTIASPLPVPLPLPLHFPLQTRAPTTASDLISSIMPTASTCPTTSNTLLTSQCRTPSQAAPYLITAMTTYSITHPLEIAGILALIGYESADMAYKINTVAAHAASGQGTSNQQMGSFNVEFAQSIPELEAKGPTEGNVLALVTMDAYNFMTGPWYYATKCGDAWELVESGGGGDADAWWEAYMACVGAPDGMGAGRMAYWTRAKTAFGL